VLGDVTNLELKSINIQSIYSFIWWHDITTDINAIAIYIADLDCSRAKDMVAFGFKVTE